MPQGLTAAVRNCLRLARWTPFVGGWLMSCDYTAVVAGQTCQAEVVDCRIELLGHDSVMVIVTHHRADFTLEAITADPVSEAKKCWHERAASPAAQWRQPHLHYTK